MTATIAKKENKKVFCIPSNVDNKYTRTNELIQEGAMLVRGADDILRELNIQKTKEKYKAGFPYPLKKEANINSKYKKVYNTLSYEPIHINRICENLQLNIQEVSSTLTILELEGHIKQLPGNMFKLDV